MRKSAIAILIAANLVMLAAGIVTIPPNVRGTTENTNPPAVLATDLPAASGKTEPLGTVSLSTAKRPASEEFLWYTEGVFLNGTPADAVFIEQYESVKGGWKGLIIYDPSNEHGMNGMELLNVAIDGTKEDASVTFDWYWAFWANEDNGVDETEMDDVTYAGRWENGNLTGTGAGTLRLAQFYEQNLKQYAVGTVDTPDGIPAFIALVRP